MQCHEELMGVEVSWDCSGDGGHAGFILGSSWLPGGME